MYLHVDIRNIDYALCMECAVSFEVEFIVAGKLLDVFLLAHVVFLVPVDDMDHLRRKFGIELRAHFLYQDLSYGRLRKRVSVASFRSHGIVGICNGNDPREFRNIIALELIGITSSVETLVMVIGTDA